MSNFIAKAKHPKTGSIEDAEWLDDYFGHHEYGVRFKDGGVFHSIEVEEVCKACPNGGNHSGVCGCSCHKTKSDLEKETEQIKVASEKLGVELKSDWEKEFRAEFAMGDDQKTVLGAKGSADRIVDFIRTLLGKNEIECMDATKFTLNGLVMDIKEATQAERERIISILEGIKRGTTIEEKYWTEQIYGYNQALSDACHLIREEKK